jgi:hypothetical protein
MQHGSPAEVRDAPQKSDRLAATASGKPCSGRCRRVPELQHEAFPRSVKRGIPEWILVARKPATRVNRVSETARLAKGKFRAPQWRPKRALQPFAQPDRPGASVEFGWRHRQRAGWRDTLDGKTEQCQPGLQQTGMNSLSPPRSFFAWLSLRSVRSWRPNDCPLAIVTTTRTTSSGLPRTSSWSRRRWCSGSRMTVS